MIGAIRLAHMWNMDDSLAEIRECLSRLLQSDPVMRMFAVQTLPHVLQDWRLEAIRALTHRQETITDEEAKDIGPTAALEIMRARESVLKSQLVKERQRASKVV